MIKSAGVLERIDAIMDVSGKIQGKVLQSARLDGLESGNGPPSVRLKGKTNNLGKRAATASQLDRLPSPNLQGSRNGRLSNEMQANSTTTNPRTDSCSSEGETRDVRQEDSSSKGAKHRLLQQAPKSRTSGLASADFRLRSSPQPTKQKNSARSNSQRSRTHQKHNLSLPNSFELRQSHISSSREESTASSGGFNVSSLPAPGRKPPLGHKQSKDEQQSREGVESAGGDRVAELQIRQRGSQKHGLLQQRCRPSPLKGDSFQQPNRIPHPETTPGRNRPRSSTFPASPESGLHLFQNTNQSELQELQPPKNLKKESSELIFPESSELIFLDPDKENSMITSKPSGHCPVPIVAKASSTDLISPPLLANRDQPTSEMHDQICCPLVSDKPVHGDCVSQLTSQQECGNSQDDGATSPADTKNTQQVDQSDVLPPQESMEVSQFSISTRSDREENIIPPDAGQSFTFRTVDSQQEMLTRQQQARNQNLAMELRPQPDISLNQPGGRQPSETSQISKGWWSCTCKLGRFCCCACYTADF
eukprot:c26188_g1_i1 orf=511-2115(+)